jgi:hypothetical protein
MCLDICSCHLASYGAEGDNFLQWIVTGDETWEHAMEASVISCCKEIQDKTIGKQVDFNHVLGFSRAYS